MVSGKPIAETDSCDFAVSMHEYLSATNVERDCNAFAGDKDDDVIKR